MGALAAWGPALLQRKFAVSVGEVGMVFGGLAVVTGILGTFLGGILTGKLQRRWPDAGVWISGLTILAAAPVVAWAVSSSHLHLTYALFFLGMLLLFINTSPVNALTVSCLPSSVRATGVALNVLFIHLFGDAISPKLVGMVSDHLGGGGAALGQAMLVSVPTILISGSLLWWARGFRGAINSEAH